MSEMPAVVRPMLPTLLKEPFSNPDWLFEPKWDGYRVICFVHDGGFKPLIRGGGGQNGSATRLLREESPLGRLPLR